MSTIEMIVVFTGLLAFVPERPIDVHPGKDHNRIRVLVSNSFNVNPPHRPYVIIEEEFFADGIPDRCKEIANYTASKRFHLCSIRPGDKITFSPIKDLCKAKGCVDAFHGDGPKEECPNDKNSRDLTWMLPVKDIPGVSGVAKPGPLWNPSLHHDEVWAHAVLEEGDLSVASFDVDETSSGEIVPTLLDIRHSAGTFTGAVADLVELRNTVDANAIHSIIFYNEYTKKKDEVMLKPIDGKIFLEIGNSPWDSICQKHDSIERIYHISNIYKLLEEEYPDLEEAKSTRECNKAINEYLDSGYLCHDGSRLNDPQCPLVRLEVGF